jgi:hypothetical protein
VAKIEAAIIERAGIKRTSSPELSVVSAPAVSAEVGEEAKNGKSKAAGRARAEA